MELQYISDNTGKHTAVVIPIADWNDITARHEDLRELVKEKTDLPKNASRFKGVLTKEEAEKYHTYLKQARNEWDRDI